MVLKHEASPLSTPIPDDKRLRIGSDGDGVLYLRSTSLSADAEVSNVIVGTSDHEGVAANSVILSNITQSGDILGLVNNGGNSLEWLLVDGSAGTMTLGHGLSGVTVKTASGDLTLDPAGNVLVADGKPLVIGHTSALSIAVTPSFQVIGTGNADTRIGFFRFSNDGLGPFFIGVKSRNTTPGSNTVVQDGDAVLTLIARADDGTDYGNNVAEINFQIDGTPGSNDTPGRIVLSTTPDGTNSTTEAFRITSAQIVRLSNGHLEINGQKSADPTLAAATMALFNSDGTGTGAEGDVVVGADNAAGGGDKFAVLFDYGTGSVSSARFKEHIVALADPYRALDLHASEWDERGSGVHATGFIAENVYKVFGRAGTPLSLVTEEWWTPEYGAAYGYKVGDRAPNQVHLAPIVGAHHEMLRDVHERLKRVEAAAQDTHNGWLKEKFTELLSGDPAFRDWVAEKLEGA